MTEIIENKPVLEEEDTIIQKPKRKLNDNLDFQRSKTNFQKTAVAINLAKGRAKLAAKKQQQKEEAQIKTNEIAIKKAEKLKKITARKEQQVKTIIGDDGETDVEEIEEHIVKKPKRRELYIVKNLIAKKKLQFEKHQRKEKFSKKGLQNQNHKHLE